MIDLQNWADTYKQKLIEAGYENVDTFIEDDCVVIHFDAEKADFVTNTLMIRKNCEISLMYYIGSIGSRWIAKINIDESFEKPITDMDRLNNKIFKRNLSSPYDHHAKRFIDTLKHFYNIDMTLEEYDKMCQNTKTIKMIQIYRINGAVQVAKMFLKEKWVYIIFGQSSDRGLPSFKTALPDIFSKKTMLPVPDKILKEGIDRVSFTKEAHDLVIEKKLYYQNLLQKNENLSDKELFLSDNLSQRDKIFIKKLRSSVEYGLIDAIKDLSEKYNRRIV